MRQWLTYAAFFLLVPTTAAQAQTPPTFVIRVRSLDTLVENAKLLVTLAGREEIANQVEGLIKAKIGVKGLEGIDPARPIGAYGRFGKEIEDISGAVLVPIADERSFLGLLENFNLQATKGKDGIYTIQAGVVEVYIRFANRYAYITALNTSALDPAKLVDPVQVLGKDGPSLAATVRLDQIPEAARLLATGQIEQGLDQALQQKIPNETPAQRDLRIAAAKEVIKTIVGVVNEGAEVKLTVNLDAQKKELTADISLAGKPGTELTTAIKSLGQRPSQFGALKSADAAFHGALHLVFPDALKKSFGKLIEEGAQQAVTQIQDAAKRQQAEKLLDALNPTLRSGEIDGFIQVLGPSADRKYTFLAGAKLHEGTKLGTTVHDLLTDAVKQLPDEYKKRIHLSAASVGDVKIHRFELPDEDENVRKLREAVGDTNLYVAFKNDALLMAVGAKGLDTLKTAIAAPGTGPSPMFLFEIDVARFAALAPTDELRNSAKKLFAGPKDGIVRIAVEGGQTLRLTLTTRLAVLQFFAQAHELKAGN